MINGEKTRADLKNLELLLDIPLDVSIEVGRSKMLVRDLLQMNEGYVIELGKQASEPLDVYVNSRLIARGEVVLVEDKLGLRLTDVVSPAERIEKLA
ncbi:MAG: flagellar motor switch protein FliN [Desulfuromonas thiophila]|nr:flagellar motor switch protein FliN [Desulfuromonas thiophila]